MKKVSITLLTASLLTGALYANSNQMNHSNNHNMTTAQMQKFHQECLAQLKNNTTKSNISKIQQEQLDLLSTDNTDLYTG